MKKLNDRKEQKKLSDDFKKEMDKRNVDWNFMGIAGLMKLIYWDIFSRYRLIYFYQRCCNGMSHVIAWKLAKEEKDIVLSELKQIGWEK